MKLFSKLAITVLPCSLFIMSGIALSQDDATAVETSSTQSDATIDAVSSTTTDTSAASGGFSGKFSTCEVQGVYYTMTAALLCYENQTQTKTWVSCSNMEKGCPKPQPAPIFVKCPESVATSAEVTALRIKASTLAGACTVQPVSPQNIKIGNFKDISFIYMALKDGLVLSNVLISNGQLVNALLSRNTRLSERLAAEGNRMGMERHAMPVSADMPQPMIKQTAEQACEMQTARLNNEKDMLEAQIESFTQAKANCQGGLN